MSNIEQEQEKPLNPNRQKAVFDLGKKIDDLNEFSNEQFKSKNFPTKN